MSKQNANSAIDLLIASIWGAAVAMIITMIVCAAGASLMRAERVGEGSSGIISIISLVLSSAIGAMMALRKAGHHRIITCLGTGLIYWLILWSCTAMLFEGDYQSVGTTALAVLGGCGCTVLLGLKEKRPKSRYTKYHNMKLVQNRQTGN